MKARNNITLERLKQNIAVKSGCSVIYLKALKSDLSRILKHYAEFSDIDFDISESGESYNMSINVKVNEFFDIGRGE